MEEKTAGLQSGIRKEALHRVFDAVYFPVVSIIATFVIAGAMLYALGFDPLAAFGGLISGSIGSLRAWGETFNKAGPVILTGLSYAIAKKCGFVNLGAEGQVWVGALLACLVGTNLNLPAPVMVPLCLAVAFIGSALYGTIPAYMKVKFNSSELITTIMLNYIALYFVRYLISGPIKDHAAASNFAQSCQMPACARLPRIVPGTRMHAGILVAVLALIAYWFILYQTTAGYEMRVIGMNRTAARCAGMNTGAKTLLSMFIAGGFAGLAGACELMGMQFRIMENAFEGIGFDGIAVALLGNSSAGGVMLSGTLLGAIKSGASKMQMKSGAPVATIYMLQGIIILCVIGKVLFDYRRIAKKKAGRK